MNAELPLGDSLACWCRVLRMLISDLLGKERVKYPRESDPYELGK